MSYISGRGEVHAGFYLDKLKERSRLECQGVDGRMILKMEEVPHKNHGT